MSTHSGTESHPSLYISTCILTLPCRCLAVVYMFAVYIGLESNRAALVPVMAVLPVLYCMNRVGLVPVWARARDCCKLHVVQTAVTALLFCRFGRFGLPESRCAGAGLGHAAGFVYFQDRAALVPVQ